MLRFGGGWVQNKATIGCVKRNDPEKLKVKRWKTVLNLSQAGVHPSSVYNGKNMGQGDPR